MSMKLRKVVLSLMLAYTCNQAIYDELYRRVVDINRRSKQTKLDMDNKNNSIEVLRKLCNGQKSTYERLNPL